MAIFSCLLSPEFCLLSPEELPCVFRSFLNSRFRVPVVQRSCPILALLILLAAPLLPAPVPAAQEAEPLPVAAVSHDDLGLYLDSAELVETASRYPKPLSQVAENVTVITAREIELLHAHTVYEVLAPLPGLFVSGFGEDFGSSGQILCQGSENRHTLVLIDGVRLNNTSAGDALTNGLPPGIIKRIEVIKGPASSSWGSSLGGVVNIITKETGSGPRPSGEITASAGERGTTESSAQAGGLLGPLGYYLYGGHQETDGHWRDNWFDNEPLYAKLSLPLPRMTLGASIGYTAPRYQSFEAASLDRADTQVNRSTFSTVSLDALLGGGFNLHLAASRFSHDFDWQTRALGLGGYATATHVWAPGELASEDIWREKTDNLSGRLGWSSGRNSALIGFESSRGDLGYRGDWVYWSEAWDYPALPYTAVEERRAAFANAALVWGRLTLSPGLRYDFSSVSEAAVSPSLGATWRLGDDTILRGTVAKGFNTPNLADLFDRRYGNPDLDPERVTSVQAGVETTALAPLRLAATLFTHRVSEVKGLDEASWLRENQGVSRRHGLELEADTAPWHRLSLGVKAAVVSEEAAGRNDDPMYAANLTLLYDNPDLVTLRLGGRYLWWNEVNQGERPRHDDVIWDLALSRRLFSSATLRAEAFVVGRNLLNGSHYWDIDYQNPNRWLEAGVTVKF